MNNDMYNSRRARERERERAGKSKHKDRCKTGRCWTIITAHRSEQFAKFFVTFFSAFYSKGAFFDEKPKS